MDKRITASIIALLVLISLPLYAAAIMDHNLTQTGILVYGIPTLSLIGFKNHNIRRWAYLSAILGQPFWFMATINNNQWGMLLLVCFYTVSWSNGIYQHWIKKNEHTKDCQ